jgi:hypothetical protein
MHSFDPKIAEMVGIAPAVIYQNIVWWIAKNEANEQNFYDGHYWTYNSVKAFSTLFPYLTEKQIRTSLDKLVEVGLLLTGNYNASAYDRTKWFRLSTQIHLPQKANQLDPQGEPIPDIKPPIKPVVLDTNVSMPTSSQKPKRKSRIKADWCLTEHDWEYARSKGMLQEEITNEEGKFREYYLASGATWLDWGIVWNRWVGRYLERRSGKAGKPNPVRDDDKPQTFLGETLRLIKEREGYGYGG